MGNLNTITLMIRDQSVTLKSGVHWPKIGHEGSIGEFTIKTAVLFDSESPKPHLCSKLTLFMMS